MRQNAVKCYKYSIKIGKALFYVKSLAQIESDPNTV